MLDPDLKSSLINSSLNNVPTFCTIGRNVHRGLPLSRLVRFLQLSCNVLFKFDTSIRLYFLAFSYHQLSQASGSGMYMCFNPDVGPYHSSHTMYLQVSLKYYYNELIQHVVHTYLPAITIMHNYTSCISITAH